MVRSVWNKLLVSCTLSALAVALFAAVPQVNGQEKKEEAKPAAAKPGEKKAKAPAKGRLPNFYTDVVTGEQRDKIYAIQNKYKDELAKLQEQVKAISAKRDAEIETLLSPEQKDKVAKAAAEAKAKATKNAEEKKKAEAAKAAAEATTKTVPAATGTTPAPKK